ncbi:MAG: PspC domain-containing protein [Sciscionella sp.]
MNETTSQTPHRPVKTFRRSRHDRMIAGVCGGAAELFGVDAAIIRIIMVAATLLGFGTGILIYLACLLLVPEAD